MTAPSPTRYLLDVAPDAAQLARRCAERVASLIDLALDERDRAQIALSGGSTPAAAYRLLNGEHLPWNRVDVVLGDERWVPPTDPASNARMLSETLLAAEQKRRAAYEASFRDISQTVSKKTFTPQPVEIRKVKLFSSKAS